MKHRYRMMMPGYPCTNQAYPWTIWGYPIPMEIHNYTVLHHTLPITFYYCISIFKAKEWLESSEARPSFQAFRAGIYAVPFSARSGRPGLSQSFWSARSGSPDFASAARVLEMAARACSRAVRNRMLADRAPPHTLPYLIP